jgi:hypothetical protein
MRALRRIDEDGSDSRRAQKDGGRLLAAEWRGLASSDYCYF